MTETDIKGQGGAFEIGRDGAVQRIEGTAEAPAPLPPTTSAVDPDKPAAAKPQPQRVQAAAALSPAIDGKKD